MNLLRLREKNPFEDIATKCQEVCKCSRPSYSRRVVDLLRYMFPPQATSNINDIYNEAVDSFTTKWVKKIKYLIEVFKPNNHFGQSLIVNRQQRTDFKSLGLGSEYEAYFVTKEATQLLSVKKEMNNLTLPIFECFFIKMIYSLFCFKQYEKKGSWKESFQNDDFHYYILRNPILHIIRQWLIYTRTRPVIFNRIVNVMEILLLRQPIFRFRKGESSVSIKSYHFYGLYLLIQWKTSNIVWEFLSFIVDYLQAKQKNFNILFCCWVRLHLILLKRGSAYEIGIRKDLQDGLQSMQLQKVRIQSIQSFNEQIKEIDDQYYLDHLFIQMDSLLSKELWAPSAQILTAAVTIMFMIESYKADNRKFQSSLVAQVGKIIQKIQFSLRKKEDKYIKNILEEIKKRFHSLGGNFESQEMNEQNMSQDFKRGSLFSQQGKGSNKLSKSRNSFVSFQKQLSPWQRPLKMSESHLFYVLGFTIARGIDKLKGKEEQFPSTNLRFLASFKTIAVLVAFIVILILLFH